jgi:hypothetical protein
MTDVPNTRAAGELRIPHVVARIVNGAAVIVCPYCGREHTHGAEAGYRMAHCGAGTGYTMTLPDMEISRNE